MTQQVTAAEASVSSIDLPRRPSEPVRFWRRSVGATDAAPVPSTVMAAMVPLLGSWYGLGFPYLSSSLRGLNSSPATVQSDPSAMAPVVLMRTVASPAGKLE